MTVNSLDARRRSIAAAAQLACLLEASAPKPGNVSPGRSFPDMGYHDFLASAVAIGPVFANADRHSLGQLVHQAVASTSSWVPANTNLGIVLLLAPLAKAAMSASVVASTPESPRTGLIEQDLLWRSVNDLLAATTIDDAREVYAAIRLAGPGGLGRVDQQDVSGEPSVTLAEAMQLAAGHDGVAREYATGYQVTRGISMPALQRARRDGLSWEEAIAETFLTVLSHHLDTHIARKAGRSAAAAATEAAAAILAAGGVRTPDGRTAVDALDRSLRDRDHAKNPGTTADLTAASVFAVLLVDGWRGISQHE